MEETCKVAERMTEGVYYCTREPDHEGPCAAKVKPEFIHLVDFDSMDDFLGAVNTKVSEL
jgi:hypothetical protein